MPTLRPATDRDRRSDRSITTDLGKVLTVFGGVRLWIFDPNSPTQSQCFTLRDFAFRGKSRNVMLLVVESYTTHIVNQLNKVTHLSCVIAALRAHEGR